MTENRKTGVAAADELLAGMSSASLYAKSEFVAKNARGCVIANVDLTDPEALRELLRALKSTDGSDLAAAEERALVNFEHKRLTDMADAVSGLLSGDAMVFMEGEADCVLVNVRKYETRAVAEPPTSGVIKGPREGFIESIKTNLSLLERKLRTPKLKVERLKIGRSTSTDVAVVYVDGIADAHVAEEILARLKKIDIDGIIDAHYLQSYLEPRPYSIFAQAGTCEKPDIAAAKLLEGRVAVLCDGSPIVLTLPFMYFETVQSADDYYQRSAFASLVRIARAIALALGILLPGAYVALEIYHFSVLPYQLLLTIINAAQGVPLPPLAEILFVMLLFEVIREAGVRMPQAMGLAMSVVGALVLGDTAVKAGMIGSTAVMMVALSSIATYTVPDAADSSSLLRLLFTLAGGLLGLFGLLVGVVITLTYVAGLNGYGTPYLAPYAPCVPGDKRDGLLKKPVTDMDRRPSSLPGSNKTRQKEG